MTKPLPNNDKKNEEYEKAKAMDVLLKELQKGRDSGGYHTSEEVRDLINNK